MLPREYVPGGGGDGLTIGTSSSAHLFFVEVYL